MNHFWPLFFFKHFIRGFAIMGGEFADIDHLIPREIDHPGGAENAVEATIFLWVNTYQLWPTLQSA